MIIDTSTALLDDVLFAFRQENALPTPDVVDEWRARYPRFAEAISEEAVLWAEQEMMASLHREEHDDVQATADAEAWAAAAVERAAVRTVEPPPAASLADALCLAGLDQDGAARQLGFPRSVMVRIIRGDVMGATIPQTFTTMFARLLGRCEEWLYDRYPATLATAQGSECQTSARSGFGTISFQHALADAEDANDEERRFWLEDA